MAIGNIVHSIRNIMRKDSGVDGDAQRISEMTWMIFLKVFDAMEEEREAEDDKYKSPMPKEARWRNWASDDEGMTGDELYNFISDKVFGGLKNLDASEDKQARIVKQVFEETNTYMKNGVLMRQVINEINKIDFTKDADRHMFNDIYETILKELQSAGSSGEFYTPRAVTQFIVDIIDPKINESVLDPACGTGGFLICALNHMKKKNDSLEDMKLIEQNIYGVEKKSLPHLLCMTNMILHDLDTPNVIHGNSLSKPLRDIGSKDMIDCVVTNPPFGGAEEDGIENNFPSEFRTRETADLFLVMIMKRLKECGRCGIVLPDGFLFGEGVKTRIKAELLSEFNLHTIIRLPNGVFNPYTGIRTNLLFFEKGKPTKDIWYFEHPLPEGYKTYNKSKPIAIKEFDLEKDWWNNREDGKFKQYSWKVSVEEIQKRNYNLDINNPNSIEEEDSLSSAEIIEKLDKNFKESSELLEKIKGEI
ncbi:N-6 DNA methylase [Candidatus Pacearchaeota archaeon]|nr:N-6 DNA methylase [Candidatus Pacearchaeota archaeon]